MSIYNSSFFNTQLSKQTSIFGLRLWVVIGVFLGSLIVVTLFLLSICLTSRKRRNQAKKPTTPTKHYHFTSPSPNPTPPISKEIQEVAVVQEMDARVEAAAKASHSGGGENNGQNCCGNSTGSGGIGNAASSTGSGTNSCGSSGRLVEVSHLGWGRWYTLREVEEATGGFSPQNVIGEGGYGIVYSGVLGDGSKVAVKNLLNNR